MLGFHVYLEVDAVIYLLNFVLYCGLVLMIYYFLLNLFFPLIIIIMINTNIITFFCYALHCFFFSAICHIFFVVMWHGIGLWLVLDHLLLWYLLLILNYFESIYYFDIDCFLILSYYVVCQHYQTSLCNYCLLGP